MSVDACGWVGVDARKYLVNIQDFSYVLAKRILKFRIITSGGVLS